MKKAFSIIGLMVSLTLLTIFFQNCSDDKGPNLTTTNNTSEEPPNVTDPCNPFIPGDCTDPGGGGNDPDPTPVPAPSLTNLYGWWSNSNGSSILYIGQSGFAYHYQEQIGSQEQNPVCELQFTTSNGNSSSGKFTAKVAINSAVELTIEKVGQDADFKKVSSAYCQNLMKNFNLVYSTSGICLSAQDPECRDTGAMIYTVKGNPSANAEVARSWKEESG